ncbi:MAG: hypothetical protein K8S27_15790 [Candidatus Omnitrophica bacterium]|nr:hypothetical protein [Candidatus Omnitrophota bacterium]
MRKKIPHLLSRTLSVAISLSFLINMTLPLNMSFAQGIEDLPEPGAMVKQSRSTIPPTLKGLIIYPEEPFQFDFILNKGTGQFSDEELKDESVKLIKYFLASLTFPENEMWVNLSPYEKERIIPQAFGETDMGRDLLAQDYLLKQLTASLIYPEEELGREFWETVYEQAGELYGTTDIPVNTFNKVWIVPNKVEIYENGDRAYVVHSRLEVMLEKDYLAMKENFDETNNKEDAADPSEFSSVSTQVLKDIIIPEIEKEVNEGENFAKLRQIYNSFILAAWYKRNLKESILNLTYSNQKKVNGLETGDATFKARIYDQYLEAFKKGVYDYIKEDYDSSQNIIRPRKYFSGGINLDKSEFDAAMLNRITPEDEVGNFIVSNVFQQPQTADISAEATRVFTPLDAAMLAETVNNLFETSQNSLKALRSGWEINQDERDQIIRWLETDRADVLSNEILFKKFINYIQVQYSSGNNKNAKEFLNVLAQKWKLPSRQAVSEHLLSVLKWMLANKIKVKGVSESVLHDFFTTYVDTYNAIPYLKSEFVYLLPTDVDNNQKLALASENIRTMTTMFSRDFVSSRTILKTTIPGTDYFIGMRFGIAESTFGLYMGIGQEQNGVDPLEGLFMRIGLDSQGETLRINMMQGVSAKQEMINNVFPKSFAHLHPSVVLLYVALEMAYHGHADIEDGVLSPARLPFRELVGIRPDFIPTMANGEPTLKIMAAYSRFGLRRGNEFARFQSVDHLVRNTLASRLAAKDHRANMIKKVVDSFENLQELEWDRAMLTNIDDKKGGIDFNSNFLDIQTGGNAVELSTPINFEGLENIRIEGLEPLIINISPVINLYQLLGVKREEESDKQQEIS